jgi:DNA-binding LytR/AlgR family response regulator
MKIAILDDDALFTKELDRLIRLCCAQRDWPLECQIFHSAKSFLAEDLSSIQVAFLDIDMPDLSGLEVARILRQTYPELILVFVTAWIQYAPAGYCVNALRYLLKNQLAEEIPPCLDAIQEKLFENKETILVEQADATVEIALKDILYFEGTARRRVLLHTQNAHTPAMECVGKLSDYAQRLESRGFLRIHKSFLVNMYYIDRIVNYTALLRNGVKIKVSEKNYKEICQQYVLWKGMHL